ncbi:hypothetical protein RIF23_18530 [Lipingzhangella sp. LS1_29]|uniref:Uncharacterized protein n=1 Tax=Lipingzhangella rawalii TaxID=2055835 RepID=A0ABU2HAD5_9ACTN|nr:hypothetical protein [Lipingzhangella rawalii]MDS1272290.1 hypothetical protein [Lipingzhangella rawalii]
MDVATKPERTQPMITAAEANGTPATGVTPDEVYGQNFPLRQALEQQRVGYVMTVPHTERILLSRRSVTVGELAEPLPHQAWQKRSGGSGAKGQRFFEWALIEAEPGPEGAVGVDTPQPHQR